MVTVGLKMGNYDMVNWLAEKAQAEITIDSIVLHKINVYKGLYIVDVIP